MANKLVLELLADTNNLLKGLEQAQRSLNKFVDSAGTAGSSLGGGVNRALDAFTGLASGGARAAGVLAGGLVAAATAAAVLTASAGKQVEAIDHLSQKTGIAVSTLQGWSVVMAENNFQAETLASGMRTLSKFMTEAKDPASAASIMFEEMGVSLESVGSTEDVLRAVADRFKAMPDGADKARLAVSLFGKAGLEMIPVLNKGAAALDESRQAAQRFGLVLSTEQVAALDRVDNALDRLGSAFDGLKLQLAASLAGPLADFYEWMTKAVAKATETIPIFKKMGEALTFAPSELPAIPQGPVKPPLQPGMTKILPPPSGAQQQEMLNALPNAPAAAAPPNERAMDFARGTESLTVFLSRMQVLIKDQQLSQDLAGRAIVLHSQMFDVPQIAAYGKAQEQLGRNLIEISNTESKRSSEQFANDFANGKILQRLEEDKAAALTQGNWALAEAVDLRIQETQALMGEQQAFTKAPDSGPFVESIAKMELAISNLMGLYPQLTREEARLQAMQQQGAGEKVVQDSQRQIDSLTALSRALDIAADTEQAYADIAAASYQRLGPLFGDYATARQYELDAIDSRLEASTAKLNEELAKQLITQQEYHDKVMQLDLNAYAKRQAVADRFPSFMEKQLKDLIGSNSFSMAQITSTWTSGIANMIVHGGNLKAAWQSTQTAVLQATLNTGVQMLAQGALMAARELGLLSATEAAKLGLRTASEASQTGVKVAGDAARVGSDATANAAMVATNAASAVTVTSFWEGTGAAIVGTFGVITGAIGAFWTETLLPMFTAVGGAIIDFLSATAVAMEETIFGIPVGIAIMLAVGGIVAALAALGTLKFAKGGIVTGPTLGMIGEAGSKEAVIPLNGRGASFMQSVMGGAQGSGSYTQTIVLDGRVLARSVSESLPSVLRMGGVPA